MTWNTLSIVWTRLSRAWLQFQRWVHANSRVHVGLLGPKVSENPPTPTPHEEDPPWWELMASRSRRAADGIPAPYSDPFTAAFGASQLMAATRVRATRAERTNTRAASALRAFAMFVEKSGPDRGFEPRFPSDSSIPTTFWDTAMELWGLHEFEQRKTKSSTPAKTTSTMVGAARAALIRLGYVEDVFPNSKGSLKALGCEDEGSHRDAIFVWEIGESWHTRPPRNVWERCAYALAVVGALGAARTGNSARILIEEASIINSDTIRLAPRERTKPNRVRAGRAPLTHRPIIVKHWMVRELVIPWIHWHKGVGSAKSAYLFPSITHESAARSQRSPVGFFTSGMWVEPLKQWTPRALKAALQMTIPAIGGRTFGGFRTGNNIEMMQLKDQISALTRRVIHGRSTKALIGSESAYAEVMAEDMALATSLLGSWRIESNEGVFTKVAHSPSQGEEDDWVCLAPNAITSAGPAATTSDSDESSDDDESSSEDDRVSGSCIRCGRFVEKDQHGYLCDHHGCTAVCCVSCNPAGYKGEVRCAEHSGGEMKKGATTQKPKTRSSSASASATSRR